MDQWSQRTFRQLKSKLVEALVLALPDFSQPFQVECDAINVGIGAGLMQEGRPVAYFSEKLSDAKLKYSTFFFFDIHTRGEGEFKLVTFAS